MTLDRKRPKRQTSERVRAAGLPDESRAAAGEAGRDPSQQDAAGGFPIVGIGASAGGLEAFKQLLGHLPDDTGMGFVYLTLDNEMDGAVLLLVDVDTLKQSERAMAAARDYAESTIETVREPLVVLDERLRVDRANRSFYRTFRLVPAEAIGKVLYDLGNQEKGT